MLFIAHMFAYYRSHVAAAILFWSWQRSAYVVAMFAYYRSHVCAAILNLSQQRSVCVVAMQRSVYVVAMWSIAHMWPPPFCFGRSKGWAHFDCHYLSVCSAKTRSICLSLSLTFWVRPF